jgi:hypothetical protein
MGKSVVNMLREGGRSRDGRCKNGRLGWVRVCDVASGGRTINSRTGASQPCESAATTRQYAGCAVISPHPDANGSTSRAQIRRDHKVVTKQPVREQFILSAKDLIAAWARCDGGTIAARFQIGSSLVSGFRQTAALGCKATSRSGPPPPSITTTTSIWV